MELNRALRGHSTPDPVLATKIDRIDRAGTDFRNLALPPDRLSPDFVTTKYEVLKPLPPIVLEGPIKPWFDQPGLGKQYFFNKGMQQYVDAGYLKAVP